MFGYFPLVLDAFFFVVLFLVLLLPFNLKHMFWPHGCNLIWYFNLGSIINTFPESPSTLS